MSGITNYGCTGLLTVNGLLLNCPAWDLVDLTDLWMGADLRGDDVVIPHKDDGVQARRRRITATQYSLPGVMDGSVTTTGVENSDPWEGLQAHIDQWRSTIIDPPGIGDGTLIGVLTMPNGQSRYADVHVMRFTKGQVLQGRLLFTLDISLPGGVFAP